MDENNNPFKSLGFYVAYVITTGLGLLLFCINDIFMVFIFNIIYVVVGFCVWVFIGNFTKSIALGILLGSITSFVVVFISTGGCGIFAG